MPEALFKISEGGGLVFRCASELVRGCQVLAADGDFIEVLSAQVQQAEWTVELHGDGVVDQYTACHRVKVRDGCKLVRELSVGDEVICSNETVRVLTDVRCIQASKQVVQIVFRPDKFVESFIPPREAVLTKGTKPKNPGPVRRGGRQRRLRADLRHIPGTPDAFSD